MGGKDPKGYTCPYCGTENIKVRPVPHSYFSKIRTLKDHLTPNGSECRHSGMVPTDKGSSYEETNKGLDRIRNYESFDYWNKNKK